MGTENTWSVSFDPLRSRCIGYLMPRSPAHMVFLKGIAEAENMIHTTLQLRSLVSHHTHSLLHYLSGTSAGSDRILALLIELV